MNLFKKIIILCMTFVLIFSFVACKSSEDKNHDEQKDVTDGTELWEDGFSAVVKNGKAVITGNYATEDNVVIPETIEGFVVTEIGDEAFKIPDEEVVIMTVECNELLIEVCINKIDLYGEPAVGRRFKGVIWLQGYINFPSEI